MSNVDDLKAQMQQVIANIDALPAAAVTDGWERAAADIRVMFARSNNPAVSEALTFMAGVITTASEIEGKSDEFRIHVQEIEANL